MVPENGAFNDFVCLFVQIVCTTTIRPIQVDVDKLYYIEIKIDFETTPWDLNQCFEIFFNLV